MRTAAAAIAFALGLGTAPASDAAQASEATDASEPRRRAFSDKEKALGHLREAALLFTQGRINQAMSLTEEALRRGGDDRIISQGALELASACYASASTRPTTQPPPGVAWMWVSFSRRRSAAGEVRHSAHVTLRMAHPESLRSLALLTPSGERVALPVSDAGRVLPGESTESLPYGLAFQVFRARVGDFFTVRSWSPLSPRPFPAGLYVLEVATVSAAHRVSFIAPTKGDADPFPTLSAASASNLAIQAAADRPSSRNINTSYLLSVFAATDQLGRPIWQRPIEIEGPRAKDRRGVDLPFLSPGRYRAVLNASRNLVDSETWTLSTESEVAIDLEPRGSL